MKAIDLSIAKQTREALTVKKSKKKAAHAAYMRDYRAEQKALRKAEERGVHSRLDGMKREQDEVRQFCLDTMERVRLLLDAQKSLSEQIDSARQAFTKLRARVADLELAGPSPSPRPDLRTSEEPAPSSAVPTLMQRAMVLQQAIGTLEAL